LQGYESKVIQRSKYDKFGIYRFYKDYVSTVTSEEAFLKYSFEEAKSADIIHIHAIEQILLKLRTKFEKPRKTIILHYHGTDIRGSKKRKLPHRSWISDMLIRSRYTYRRLRKNELLEKRIRSKAQMLADFVIISTPDLRQYLEKSVTGIYLPNPVDIDHFKPDNKIIAESNNSHLNQNKKEALTIDNEILNIKQALDYLKYNNINLNVEVHDRMKCPIMHSDMPNFPKGYKSICRCQIC
jgi:glycosyltransferase involved in cell wall biosynthesis